MKANQGVAISEHFSCVSDPRMVNKSSHLLIDIISITICAVICGADDWTNVELFGRSKETWLKKFLKLPNGIPSHDTFGRVFSMILTEELEKAFLSWVKAIAEQVSGVVAIDGKTLRRSYDASSNKKAIHMVSAWAAENGLVLGQIKTAEKSNEITAIPALLELLEINGCIVTIDAMGCQKEIAAQIVEKKADYVLALKRNQEGLYDEVFELFQHAQETNFDGLPWDFHETEERHHGRHEIRRYWTITDLVMLTRVKEWPQLRTVGMVESECTCRGKTTREYRFYVSSLDGRAEPFAQAIRSHWGIENSLHWVLDMSFREDESRIRKGNAAENFSIIRRLALNLIKQEKSTKKSVKSKRLLAGWDDNYFLKILAAK